MAETRLLDIHDVCRSGGRGSILGSASSQACMCDADDMFRITEKVLRGCLTFEGEVRRGNPKRSIYSDSSIPIAWKRNDKVTDLWPRSAFVVKLKGGEPELLSVPSAKYCPR